MKAACTLIYEVQAAFWAVAASGRASRVYANLGAGCNAKEWVWRRYAMFCLYSGLKSQ